MSSASSSPFPVTSTIPSTGISSSFVVLTTHTGIGPAAAIGVFTTGPSVFATPSVSAGTASSSPAPDFGVNTGQILQFARQLNVALGAMEIGLVLATFTFGIVCMKALTYFRARGADSILAKSTVAGMVILNFVQIVATIHAVYNAVVVDFDNFTSLLGNLSSEWSILLQILLMTVTACLAQTFFAFRLRAVKRNMLFTFALLFFILVQFVSAIYSVIEKYTNDYIPLVLVIYPGDTWPMILTYSAAAGINVTIAGVAYKWMQQPYVQQKQGKTTVMDEVEYWTVKSLFGCAFVSIFCAIAVGTMVETMTWLAATFVLGNLYTLSVILTIEGRPAHVVSTRTVSAPTSSHRASELTLAEHEADLKLWEDTVKMQAIKASLADSEPKVGTMQHQHQHQHEHEEPLPMYMATGYHVHDGAAV